MVNEQLASFREVLGHFASGVTVVTGMTGSGPAGFTCQSFSSLSLEPPLVLLLPGKSSTSWPPIGKTGRFCVSILADDQKHVSSAFARSGSDKFAGITWSPSPAGLPIIEGACAWIDCEVDAVHSGGDHWIVVGAVRALAGRDDACPLLFHRSNYTWTTKYGAER